jgi:uncharacterized protein YabN with tetrapyrrole methylase and pyrophosphatase domain
VANVARLAGLDPETCLHGTVERFGRRFRRMEEDAEAGGRPLESLTLDEKETLWLAAKAREPA